MSIGIKILGGILLYFAIGVFLCTIADELGFIDITNDDLAAILVCIWPLTLAILIIGAVVIVFPVWLAKAVMERVKRRKEERED